MKKTPVLVPIVFSTLVACGGGGGGESNSDNTTEAVSNEPPSNNTNTTTTNTEEGDASRTQDILVPSGFSFATDNTLNIYIDQETLDNKKAYLSICKDFSVNEKMQYTVNYENCLLRTLLDTNDFEASLHVTNDINRLVAAVWYLDSEHAPLFIEWNNEGDFSWIIN